MDENQWMYDNIMSKEVNRYENVYIFFIKVDEFMDFNYCICLLFFVYLKYMVESAHWTLKRLLQNSL